MGLLEDFKRSQPAGGLLEGFKEQKEQTDGGLLRGFRAEAVSSVAPLIPRPRVEEFIDASARGLARMGSAFETARAKLAYLGGEHPITEPHFGMQTPKQRARRKQLAADIRGNAEFLWKLSQNPGLAAQNKDLMSKALNLIGETLPYITATTAAFIATGPLGAFGVGSMVEGNSAYRTALDEGVPEDKAKMIGVAVGIVSGAVEAFGGRGAEALLLKATSKIKGKLMKAGAVLTIGSVIEALEEGAQEIAHLTGETTYRDVDWNEATNRTLGAMAGGAFLGGIMRGGSVIGRGATGALELQKAPFEPPPTARAKGIPAPSPETMILEPRETIVTQEQKGRMFTKEGYEVPPQEQVPLSRGMMEMEEWLAAGKPEDVTPKPPAARAARVPEEDIIAAAYYEDKIAKIESALLKTPDDKILQTSLVMAKRGLMKATGKIAPAERAEKTPSEIFMEELEFNKTEQDHIASYIEAKTPQEKAAIKERAPSVDWTEVDRRLNAWKNPYLRMPLDRVKEDAANGVRLAKDALVELQEVIITPASTGQKNKIIRTAVGRGLEQKHLSALSKQITGIEDLDLLTSDDADELLKALDNYRYMDTWKTESVTKEPDKLIDPSMTKAQMAGILKASGSIEAYNKAMIYSQKLGGAPSDPGLAAIWHRDMINHSRYLKREIARQERKGGEANILNPYQSISYALDKAERRTGIPLRRQWSNMVADVKGWNYKNEERMWTAIRNAKVHRLGIVTNRAESTKIAKWLDEGDEALRLNMWNDMSSKTQALATELDGMLQEYAPFLVRWGRFLVWDRHARIGEEILNKLHRAGKTPTDKQITKAQKLMREKKPPDAPMSALAEGRAARDLGQLADWLDTQGWGTRKRYYMSEGAELAGDIYEGSISEEIFGKAPEAGELTTEAPRELKARRAKGRPVISTNAALDVLRHLDRLSAFASTYENRMNFWEAFRSTNPNKDDLGLMRDADRALRGIMPRTLPIIKSFRDVNRFFWRSYLVFDPAGSLWFAWRQLLQNVAFDASQFNSVELMKSIRSFSDMSKAKDWAQNNPDAAESFMDFYNRNVAENRSFYRHFIMKSEEAGGLEMTSKAGTLIDMLAITPGITDSANRMAVWPVAYDIAQRNIAQFRDGRLSPQGLWNRLALNTITPGQSMEMVALLRDGKDAEFMSRYAEYKTENIHFRYNPLLRSLQEMTPTGRVTLGLLTFPRGVINIAIKNGLEPIASMAANPSTANARRSYDGFKTLIKLFAGTSLAQSISIAVTGVSAYGLWKLLFGPSLLAPGFGKVVELLDENAFILHQAEQSGASLHETATKMVANAAKNLEMFIPLAEVMKRGYEVQKNRDGVYLYDLAIKYAKEEYLKQYQKPFDYRSRELHEKIQYMVFGKEQPKGMKSKWKESFNLERIKKW